MLFLLLNKYLSIVNLLLPQQSGEQYLSGSLAFMLTLCPFIMWVTGRTWGRDFFGGIKTKLSAFRRRLLGIKKQFSSEEDSTEHSHYKTQLITELPKSSNLPSVADMAELLVQALPASDHSEAYMLLVTQLLPKKLARLSSHPNPRQFIEFIYERLAETLQQTRPTKRIQVLRAYLCEIEIRQLYRDSLMLAVARYIKEHPDATDMALDWLASRDASKWLAMSTIDLEDEASLLAKKVERWDQFAKNNHPDIWEQHRLVPFNTRLNLEAAHKGSFHAAMGDLGSFLRAVGYSFKNIYLH